MNPKELLGYIKKDNRGSELLVEAKQKDYTGGGDVDAYKNFKIMEYIFQGLDHGKADIVEIIMIWEQAKKVVRQASLAVQPPAVKNESKLDAIDDVKIVAQLYKGYLKQKKEV